MKQKLLFIWALFAFLFAGGGIEAYAGNSDYYSKVTVTATGNGKVYVTKDQKTTPQDGDYKSTGSESNTSNASSAPRHTYYLWAKPDDGYKFTGWTGDGTSSNNPYAASFSASSTDSGSPTTKSYTANFAACTYTLGVSTCNVSNGDRLSNDEIIWTYSSANTDDANASLAVINGAKATVNGQLVDLTANNGNKTLSLRIPNFAPQGLYAIRVPAGAFGYVGKAVNEEINLTVKGPESMDYTSHITNPNIQQNGGKGDLPTGWLASVHDTGNGNYTENTGDTRLEAWNWSTNGTPLNIDYYQNITIPNGIYTLTAVTHQRANGDACLYASASGQEYSTTMPVGDGNVAQTNVTKIRVTDGSMRIGIKASNNYTGDNQWVTADDFTLTYHGNPVSNQATALAFDTENPVVAGGVYSLTVPNAGEYRFTVPSGIKYTDNADLMVSEVTTVVTASMNLEAGTYYFVAGADGTIRVETDNKTYYVGSATCSVFNNTYVQDGLVTWAFNDANTNDGTASLAVLGNVTVNETSVTPTMEGKTLKVTIPDFAPGQTYNITIPAGAVGYAGQETNEEIGVIVKTPAVFDGVYYIKDQKSRFIARGADSGTEAALLEFGMPVRVTTDANNSTTLYCMDNGLPIVENADPLIYTNGNTGNANHKYNYTLAVSGDGVSIKTERNNYINAVDSRSTFGPVATPGATEYAWTFVSAADYSAYINSYKENQAVTAARAYGLDVNSVSDIETAVASLSSTPGTLSSTFYEDWQQGGNNTKYPADEVSANVGAGLYKITFEAYHRLRGNAEAVAAYKEGAEYTMVYVKANNSMVPVVSVYSEPASSAYTGDYADGDNHYPNNDASAKAAFDAGRYVNTIWVNMTAPGTLSCQLVEPGTYSVDQWTAWRNIKYERYYQSINPGEDFTSSITNPGFEAGNITGWTCTGGNDTGAKSTTNDTYKALGSEGSYLFNAWDNNAGSPITQNIGTLPAGIFTLTAALAAEADVCLTLNEETAVVTPRGNNKKVMHKASLTFVSDGTKEYTIGAKGKTGNWYKADDFHLTYINETSAENLYNVFQSVYKASAPWTSEGEYYTAYRGYVSYSAETPQADLLAAINYMNSKYDDYCWDNASEENPYLMPNYVFGFDNTCKTNTGTEGTGRSLPEDTRPDGSTGPVWSANGGGCTRSSSMTIPYQGIYKLQAKVKKVVNESHHVDITIDGEKTVNSDLTTEWADMNIILGNIEHKESAVQVFISNTVNQNDYVRVGGIDLYYTGMQGDFVKGQTHYYFGNYATVEATDEVPVVDATLATGIATFTRTNPNGICYAANDATLVGDNVVKGNTCESLVLTDGHPFKATKQFEATSASYEMTAIASNDKVSFGTLMLPFAVSVLPGKAYTLDQGVTFGEEIHATEVNAITANTPVLVTDEGTYSASAVSVPVTTEDTYTNGELVGTYKSMNAVEGSYVLQKHNNRVAFYLVDGTQPTVKPFRAYIKAQAAGARMMRVIFDDEETGVDSLTTDDGQQTTVMYDLSGRRVQKAQKGIYIINGNKIMK